MKRFEPVTVPPSAANASRTMRRIAVWVVTALLLLTLANRARAAGQIVQVALDERASISYLLTQKDDSQPQWVLVMFAGSEGRLDLRMDDDGSLHLREKNNFLVRTRTLFADDHFATALVDAPSDQPGGYSDAFRASARHAQDVARVAADLRARFPVARLVLIGTSRGTISSAFVGRALPDTWDAVVHTSTLSSPARGQATPLIGFDYGAIAARQLFVHHVDDACFLCSFAAAQRIAQSGGYPLIAVHGGDVRSGPCEARSHHGFFGKDDAVVAAIKAWISSGVSPKEIE
ncbi:DUF2920 family protein [Paraburkholderia rhizosphaerae]|uniref:Alpha/beta hydrolase family protein n=1 Tax=Paraburkholderia rhizosphaerae TaxID=480658 RepID=A0A4R8LG35_9BURK|nr:DUF2920 family protein [Paraburkholderia rhizosphaerae]TDY42082.1 hypothetical protein BX592_12368 [Paraburkholderia rhizosphaerae]